MTDPGGVIESHMAPKETLGQSADIDWDWVHQVQAEDSLDTDNVNKLFPIITSWHPSDEQEDVERLRILFDLAQKSLLVRNDEIESFQSNETSLRKENKDLQRQVKKLRRQKTGDEELDKALEVTKGLLIDGQDNQRDIDRPSETLRMTWRPPGPSSKIWRESWSLRRMPGLNDDLHLKSLALL